MSTTSTTANMETAMQTTTIPVETTSTTQAAPITISSTEGELRTNNYFDFMFYCSLYTLYKSPAYVYICIYLPACLCFTFLYTLGKHV